MRKRTKERLRDAVARRAGAEPEMIDNFGVDEPGLTLARCAYCGEPIWIRWAPGEAPTFRTWTDEAVHLDHVIAESKNGPTSLDNTVLACAPCNLAKRDLAFGDVRFQDWLAVRRAEIVRRHMAPLVRSRVLAAEREWAALVEETNP